MIVARSGIMSRRFGMRSIATIRIAPMQRTRSPESIEQGQICLVPLAEMYRSGLSVMLADERRETMKQRIVEMPYRGYVDAAEDDVLIADMDQQPQNRQWYPLDYRLCLGDGSLLGDHRKTIFFAAQIYRPGVADASLSTKSSLQTIKCVTTLPHPNPDRRNAPNRFSGTACRFRC
jgi:hypothetical protein